MQQQKKSTSVSTASFADIGCKRQDQQDSLGYVTFPVDYRGQLAIQKGHLYIVADGVGGAEAGGLASHLAIQSIIDCFYRDPSADIAASLRATIIQTDQYLKQESQKRYQSSIQTTVVCVVIRGQELYVAHAGDSRAYLMRSNELIRLTTDHSIVQTFVQEGKLTETEAQTHPDRNLITRSLGSDKPVEPEISRYKIQADDMVLLCSDGLHGELLDDEIKTLLLSDSNLPMLCKKLTYQAKQAGGKDNISLIVTRIDAIYNVMNHFTDRGVPLEVDHVKQFTYTNLAPLPKNWGQMSSWQQIPRSWLVCLITLAFVILITFQAIWFQNVTKALQNAQNTQQELFVEIDMLITDYQKGIYGDVNGSLLQQLEHFKEQLQANMEPIPPIPTDFIAPGVPTMIPTP